MTREAFVQDLLRATLAKRGDLAPFDRQEMLVTHARLDSLSVLNIALALETEYGLDFSDDFDLYDFDGQQAIIDLLGRRLDTGGEA